MAKTKVALLKLKSIPHLELCDALLAARICLRKLQMDYTLTGAGTGYFMHGATPELFRHG